MRAVVRDVPSRWLEERAQLGLDRYDEVWEGVLHMPPAPGREHQRLGTEIVAFLVPLLKSRGIQVQYETEVHRPQSQGADYRIPDIVTFEEGRAGLVLTDRGLEGAPLAVIEILSPDDETYEKLGFYASLGIPEVVVVNPETRGAEVYRLAGTQYLAVSADERGRVHAASLDVRFSTTSGGTPSLRIEHGGAMIEI